YIALVGTTNQLVEVNATGQQIEHFPAAPFSGGNGSSVPFDNVSSAEFLGTRLIVANQSYISGNTAHMAILDVETGERGLPIYIPANAGPRVPAPRRRAVRPRTSAPRHRTRPHRKPRRAPADGPDKR